jgi:hypothetical protein
VAFAEVVLEQLADLLSVPMPAYLTDANLDAVLADNLIRTGQAACWYSWRIPPRRSRLRMLRRVICGGSAIGRGSGRSGRAFAML